VELPLVDILIPAPGSPVSLGATLAALAGQRYPSFRITAAHPPIAPRDEPPVAALVAVLQAGGHPVRVLDIDRASADGGAVQALVDQTEAPYVLVVEDGVYLEPDLIGRLVAAIRATGGAFVGSNVIDLRFRDEHRPDEEAIEFWDGPVRPEEIAVGSHAWTKRRRVHRGANLQHLRERLPRTRDRLYRVADIHGCVLYDGGKLRAVGGFRSIRDHGHNLAVPASRASAAQLRLLARHGGAGLFPSGAYRLAPAAMSTEHEPRLKGTTVPHGSPGWRRGARPAAAPAGARATVTSEVMASDRAATGRDVPAPRVPSPPDGPGPAGKRHVRDVRHALPRLSRSLSRRARWRHGSASPCRSLVVRR
jgi:hypothetical protein